MNSPDEKEKFAKWIFLRIREFAIDSELDYVQLAQLLHSSDTTAKEILYSKNKFYNLSFFNIFNLMNNSNINPDYLLGKSENMYKSRRKKK